MWSRRSHTSQRSSSLSYPRNQEEQDSSIENQAQPYKRGPFSARSFRGKPIRGKALHHAKSKGHRYYSLSTLFSLLVVLSLLINPFTSNFTFIPGAAQAQAPTAGSPLKPASTSGTAQQNTTPQNITPQKPGLQNAGQPNGGRSLAQQFADYKIKSQSQVQPKPKPDASIPGPMSPPSSGDYFLNQPAQGTAWLNDRPHCCEPGYANDGDAVTYFLYQGVGGPNFNWNVTLPQAVPINRIKFFQGNEGYCTTLTFYAGDNGRSILLATLTGVAGWNEVTFGGVSQARYWINCYTEADNGWSLSMVEGYIDTSVSNPQPYESYGGGTGVTQDTTCNTCNPVNIATGNFWHTFGDLAVPGRGFSLALSHTYNAQLSDRNGPLGYGWSHSYNSYIEHSALTDYNYLVHQGNGSIIPFNSDLSAPSRVMASLTNVSGNLVLTTTHGLDTYVYRPLNGSATAGKLDHLTDRNGNTTTLDYDTSGRLVTVTDPAGRTFTFHYDATRTTLLTSVTDDTGSRSVSFDYYSGSDQLYHVTDVAGHQDTFTYETVGGFHRLLTMTDPNSGVLTNSYDSSNRVKTQSDPMSRSLEFGYTDLGMNQTQTRITDTLGLVTVNTYDHLSLIQTKEHANAPTGQQMVTDYGYQAGTPWLGSVTDPLGHTWKYESDSSGNVLTTTDPLTRTTRFKYNATNDVTTITNTAGLTTTFGYDQWGNVTTVVHPVTETNQIITTTLTYDSVKHGDVLTTTNPLNKSWGTTYDTYGYPATTSNPLGNTTHYDHNSIGWLTRLVTPRVYTATFSYNTYGDPLAITDTRSYSSTYTYDSDRNLLTTTDANHKTITNTYNLDNEVTRVTRPDATHSDYGYDGAGRILTQTNGLGQSTLYRYDDISRVVTGTDALGQRHSVAFDLAGRTTIITDAKGLTITFGYDAANELTGITHHDSGLTPNVSYTYNTRGLRATMADGIGTSSYTYDSLNRLVRAVDGVSKAVTYTYDLGSRLTGIAYPNIGTGARNVTRGYDDANQLTSVTDWLTNTTQFGYDADGDLTGITYPSANNSNATFSYNEANEITAINHYHAGNLFLSFSYGRDNVGLLSSANEGSALGTHTYTYDALYHLSQDQQTVVDPNTRTYTIDAATEITATAYTPSGGKTTAGTRTYNAANQLHTLIETYNGTTSKNLSFTYDNNGNRTKTEDNLHLTSTSYGYDQANRLTGINPGGTNSPTYAYNGDGLRMSKSQGLGYEYFTWDIGVEAGLPLLMQDSTGAYIYGPGGMLVEQVQPGGSGNPDNPYFYHVDQLGSVRATTDGGGNKVNRYDYDAYGNRTYSSEVVSNPFGYAGEYTDAESGFIYLRARYYDPSTQQFLSVDPLLASTQEAYAYTGGNPLNSTDPTGLYYDKPGDHPFGSMPACPTSSGWGGGSGPFGGGGGGSGSGGADDGCALLMDGHCYSDAEKLALDRTCFDPLFSKYDRRCSRFAVFLIQDIPTPKLDYLTTFHPEDDKSGGFAKMGWGKDNLDELKSFLESQGKEVDLTKPSASTSYGVKFERTIETTGPNGVTGSITTVWQIDKAGSTLRFITGIARPFK